jgi:uncharacterized protein
MREKAKRVATYAAGWGFIFLGILGLVLPVLQGILFLLVGLYILSTVSPWAGRMLERLRRQFPRISEQLEAAKAKARDVQARIFKKKKPQHGDLEL